MIQKIFLILCVFILWSLIFPSAFWYSWEIIIDEWKIETIREMQENAALLKQEQEKLVFKWKTFKIWNDPLSTFIIERDDISNWILSSMIINYENQTRLLETKLVKSIEYEEETAETYRKLVDLKKNFYTQLLPYIKTEKLTLYKNYISSDVMYNEKSKVVDVERQQLEVKKKDRIEEIKEKIEVNNEVLRSSIQEKVTKKVSILLSEFTSWDRFLSLDNQQKILVFQRIKEKIQWVKDTYKITQNNSTSIIDEKLILFDIVESLVDDYITDWK